MMRWPNAAAAAETVRLSTALRAQPAGPAAIRALHVALPLMLAAERIPRKRTPQFVLALLCAHIETANAAVQATHEAMASGRWREEEEACARELCALVSSGT